MTRIPAFRRSFAVSNAINNQKFSKVLSLFARGLFFRQKAHAKLWAFFYNQRVEIYVEDVLITNFALDYAMLFCTLRLCGVKTYYSRLALSAFIGCLLSLLPLKEYFFGFTLTVRLLEGLILLLPLKIPKNKLFKCLITLILVSFSVVGGLFGLGLLLEETLPIKGINAFYIYDEDPVLTLLLSAFAILTLTAFSVGHIRRRNMIQRFVCDVSLTFDNGKTVELKAFIDSGNMIYDDESSLSIPVINYFAIASSLEYPSFERLNDFSVKTAGSDFSLKEIKLNTLVINCENKAYKYTDIKACIAISGFSEEFDVLISPELIK